jgi:hypothetical protein
LFIELWALIKKTRTNVGKHRKRRKKDEKKGPNGPFFNKNTLLA